MVKFFFNRWYKFFPPEMVGFWREKRGELARVGHSKEGAMQMEIRGEKYPFPGFPRGHVLLGRLSRLKHRIKETFNTAKGQIQKEIDESHYNLLPPEQMCPAVKELWKIFIQLEDAEITDDMKERIRLYRDVICYWLQEDDAYRFRVQWFLERLNMKNVRLGKQDKYFFRGKYFKVDHDHFDY